MTWIKKIITGLVIAVMAATFFQVIIFRYVNPPFTVNMIYEKAIAAHKNMPFKPRSYKWKNLEQISVYLQQAVLASEDQRFMSHHGFDFREIKLALKDIITRKGFRGASTISMQTARSLFLPSSRSLTRKLAEAWYTVLIELVWDKKRILEMYLNTVDWGKANVGAQAAAQAYFSCDAKNLTDRQAALLTAILPSPHKWSAVSPGTHVRLRQTRILRQMKNMPVLK
ncbi:monofunctional biosynthetic peptidoglycan transglycosylase [Desulfobacter hydrogenophilus]|uniref:Biosynthetic peptidoglycan transglycosylase n=2 Tax=Desulfobacter hydrogenophilus TaxID=2291 RepID=A0A328FGI4_9BACT|nr:monofunctional biosynthetic peptidoglycan transglycosylase [Desulfobacter hydrogenophilus]QBH15485.1 monofunctional biosynthetic peptidoglycan transglycosylase [Desulfobacter hydrogenophilus]RAM02920.1 monofunctional biosynthetic peptidoglycan transglycosylase [Desulfobacter hydrogenophilus]